ncbi:N-acetyltransferase [Agrobacterium vitis]|nr:N-acetyltransferase [Agrobacterium vitis]
MMASHIRLAEKEDADAIASVFTRSRSLLSFLPKLHSSEEDQNFIEHVVMKENTVLVAIENGRLCGFIAFGNEWIEHLYIDPNHTGQGIGADLLRAATAETRTFKLWTFQRNEGARRFYERYGFKIESMTDGSENEEKEPDILYVWSGATTA